MNTENDGDARKIIIQIIKNAVHVVECQVIEKLRLKFCLSG